MKRTEKKNPSFSCRYTKVDEVAACHGLVIAEAELEKLIYEILTKQARLILNMDNFSTAGQLDIQLAEQGEYDKQIAKYMDKKRVLYERLVLEQISIKEYQTRKAAVDSELDRLREIHSKLKMQTSQMQMKEKEKSAKTELAQEVVGANGLTAGLADTLIARVYVYPGYQVEVVWKMKDFCME